MKRWIFIIISILYFPITELSADEGLSGFSDVETEALIKDMLRIIYNQSNMDLENTDVLFLTSEDINAFINEDNNVFVFAGLILKLDTALEVFSILCHEAGHVACGHIARESQKMNQLSSIGFAMLPILIIAGIANPLAGIGGLLASSCILTHQLCLYTIAEEKAADTFAIKVLASLGYPIDGFIDGFKKVLQREMSYDIKNMTFKTHPDTIDRIRHAIEFSKAYYKNRKLKEFPKSFQERFERVFYKLSAFLRTRDSFYKNTLKSKRYIQYGEAILLHKEDKSDAAIKVLDKLFSNSPNDPYYLELRGQILYESGRLLEAIRSYLKALKFLPGSSSIIIDLSRTLVKLASDKISVEDEKGARKILNINGLETRINEQLIDLALKMLHPVYIKDKWNPLLISVMLGCYRAKNDKAMSLFMLAHSSYMEGDFRRAFMEAEESVNLLKQEKRNYLQVEDFLFLIRDTIDKKSKLIG